MGKGGKRPKTWPSSWKQTGIVGGTLTLKGRSFAVGYVVLPVRVEATDASQLDERVNEAVVGETLKLGPS